MDNTRKETHKCILYTICINILTSRQNLSGPLKVSYMSIKYRHCKYTYVYYNIIFAHFGNGMK